MAKNLGKGSHPLNRNMLRVRVLTSEATQIVGTYLMAHVSDKAKLT